MEERSEPMPLQLLLGAGAHQPREGPAERVGALDLFVVKRQKQRNEVTRQTRNVVTHQTKK